MKQLFFLITILCLFVLMGCSEEPSEKVIRYQENNEIIGPEKDELIGDVSDTIYDSIDRSNAGAMEILIRPIEAPGEEVVPSEGRYMISTGTDPESGGEPQSGRVLVYDEDEVLLIEVILNEFSRMTVDLNGSNTVHVDGFVQALLTPVATEISNELDAGIWEVGKDIEAGNYSVLAPSEFAFGYFEIFEEGQSPRVFEILNNTPDKMIDVELKDGQKIRISSAGSLQFEAQS